MTRTSTVEGSEISWLRRAWDHLPSIVRRPIVRAMSHERMRLGLLNLLGIRSKSGFQSASDGGPRAVAKAMDMLASDGPTGDYYEFGLYRGYTFWTAQKSADQRSLEGMRFFGFDSFCGLPEVEGSDRQAAIFIPGDYSCSVDEVRGFLTDHEFDWSRAALVEGFYDVSLTDEVKDLHKMGPAATVMIDCDLYQSTVPVLHFIEDLMQDGTILLFDDWHCFGGDESRGELRAFAEFLNARPQWRADFVDDYPTYGRVYVMHRQLP